MELFEVETLLFPSGTTDVVVFKNGSLAYSGVIPVAGYQFTNDICVTYNTSFQAAEAAKIQYAHTDPMLVRPSEVVILPVLGRKGELRVPRREICQLTRERAQELICLLKLKLQQANIASLSKARMVLTGGTARLPGLKEMIQQSLIGKARIGVPEGIKSMPPELREPAYATSVGIMLRAMEQRRQDPAYAANGHAGDNGQRHPSMVSRIMHQVKNRLAMEQSAAS
jgi:cell division protein FtsA